MIRRQNPVLAFVAVLAAFCSSAVHWSCAADAGKRPNILFIYADDHSAKLLSCYEGHYSLAKTPHIDALAASGVRFQGAYNGAWCMPSRASLLTGRQPHAIESMRMEGQYPGSAYDPAQCPFWPSVFRQNGYHTAQIGKWHTGTDVGFGRDWDYQIVWNRPRHPENAGNYYGPQIMEVNGVEQTIEGYSTDNYTNWACDYIKGENRDAQKPWYLWLCYGAIHGPTIPAERHKGDLKGKTAEAPVDILDHREGKPSYLANTQAWLAGPNGEPVVGKAKVAAGGGGEGKPRDADAKKPKKPQTHSEWIQQVNECYMSVDEGVGKVLQSLKDSGQLENTLVIYSSDQGFANGEHGLKQKVAPYEASYKSPFIVSRPGTIPAGKYCPHPVNAPDVIVTFFAQAGIAQPWKMHGRDITPLLADPERKDWTSPTFYESVGDTYGSAVAKALAKEKAIHSGVPYYVAVRHGPYKYVRYIGDKEPDELYDVVADPEELKNLASDPKFRATKDELHAMLVDELKKNDAEFVELVTRQ